MGRRLNPRYPSDTKRYGTDLDRNYVNQKARERYARDPENRRKRRSEGLKYRYGITIERYEEMVEEQRGLCAICNHTCKTGHALSVDHNHTTGQVRGLLCKGCNVALGHLEGHMDSASAYLAMFLEGGLDG